MKIFSLRLAFLGLLMMCYVECFTLQDYLRGKELNRLREEDMRDSSRYAKEDALRALEQDERDLNRVSMSKKQIYDALNALREFHFKRLADEKDKECKDDNPMCEYLPDEACREVEIEDYAEKYCRKRCKYCTYVGSIKSPFEPKPSCEDKADAHLCETICHLKYNDEEREEMRRIYMLENCRKTCEVC